MLLYFVLHFNFWEKMNEIFERNASDDALLICVSKQNTEREKERKKEKERNRKTTRKNEK